jgi:penicillin-binding protein 2
LAEPRRSRRFLPADPRVEEPYRLTPQLALRVAVVGFVALAVFAVLFLRLWALQVLSGTKYRVDASANRVRTIQIQAPRGTIIDSSGHVLVTNTLGTSLELLQPDLPKGTAARQRELAAISRVAQVPAAKITAELRRFVDEPLTPIVLSASIPRDEYDFFKERQFEFPGVELAQTYERSYPYNSLAAQVLGYVGPITSAELAAAAKEGYQPQDVMGQAGLEASYDRYLKGTDGSAEVTVDSLGQPTGPVETTVLPEPGNTLRLTLNVGLQRAAEGALRYGINLAHATPDGTYADGGAIVALDPRNGAILAMASNPTYHPSAFVTRNPKQLAPLLEPKPAAARNFPGTNRAIDVGYPPGSVFKPVTALAAMEENILSPTQTLWCTPTFTFYQQLFQNWDPDSDQLMELPQALAESCDTYFYRVGALFYKLPATLGPTLQKWASKFGIGAETGVDIGPQDAGILPTPAWRCHAYGGPALPTLAVVAGDRSCDTLARTWKPGYEVQLAIGQGDLLVTPLQMARFYAMIANGGSLVTPHIAEDIETPSGDGGPPQILRDLATQQLTPTGISQTALAAVQDGLYDGAHSALGTSYGVFGQFPVAVAGKTGTAQLDVSVPGFPHPLELNQSWWCGYGPFDHPTIVVCAVIENGGHGGTAAAPAALKVFEKYFDKSAVVTPHISD